MQTAGARNRSLRAGHFVVNVLLAIGTVLAASVESHTLAWETNNLFAIPWYDDMFDHVRMHNAMGSFSRFMSYAVSPHNEHRIFTGRLVSFLDERFFTGREYGQVIATNVLQALATFISWVAFVRSGYFSNRYTRLSIFFIIAIFFFNPNFLYTLIIPFQLPFGIIACICVSAALIMSEASAQESLSHLDHIRLIGKLLLLATVATLTLGNAPIVLIAAAAAAVVLRWKPSISAAMITLALIHVAAMLAITPAASARSHDVVAIFKFALMYLGSPFIRLDPWPASFMTWRDSPFIAALCGGVVFVTAVVFAVARRMHPGLGGRLAIFGFVLLTVVIGTSLAAGLSRAQFGILEGANKKYASFAALGWLGVYAVFSGVLFQLRESHRRVVPASMVMALVILLAFTLSGSRREERLWEKARNKTWEAALASFVQINDSDELKLLDTSEPEVAEYIQYAGARGIGVFAYFPFRMGDDAAAFLSSRKETTCKGEVESISPIESKQSARYFDVVGAPATISGWAWMAEEHKPATTVIAVDATNHIVGAARSIRRSARAEESLAQTFDQNLGWFGFGRTTQWQQVKFYALSNSGKLFCPLGPLGSVR